jgi:DNA-binding IclR family transcriptional regulator
MQNIDTSSVKVKSIARVAEVLKCLSEGTGRIVDICKRLDLTKGTVHRLLKTLQISGFVVQDPLDRRYYLGPLLISLASGQLTAHQSLVICAFNDLHYLRDLTGETIGLQIRVGLQRMFLEGVPSKHIIRYAMEKGSVAPVHTGSGGKVLLSMLSEQELQVILHKIKPVSLTPYTISNVEQLKQEVEKARKQGYATSYGEHVLGSAAISVPVHDYICPVALSVFGPDTRFKNVESVLKEMKESAARISKRWRDILGDGRK